MANVSCINTHCKTILFDKWMICKYALYLLLTSLILIQHVVDLDQENVGSLKQQIAKIFEESLRLTVPDELDVEPAIAPCQNPKFGDYQWYARSFCIGVHTITWPYNNCLLIAQHFLVGSNNAMGLWSKVKGKCTQFKGPQPIGQVLMIIFAISISCYIDRKNFVVVISCHMS